MENLYVGKIILLSVLFLLAACGNQEKPAGITLPLDQIREGDLAFRCGSGVLSFSVTSLEGGGQYSHIGVLVRTPEGWMIAHAVPGEREFDGDFDRVKTETPEVFFSSARASRGCLMHTGLTDSCALSHLRASALQLARDSVRFDPLFNLDDSSKVYCTEFIWRLFLNEGVDLSEGRRSQISAVPTRKVFLLPVDLYGYSSGEVYFVFDNDAKNATETQRQDPAKRRVLFQ